MRSYLEILSELMEAIDTDETMPQADKEAIKEQIQALFVDMLWKYSD